MFLHIPCENAHLRKVIRLTVLVLGENREILRNVLVSVMHFVQGKERHKPLAFGILGDLERHINVNQPAKHPSNPIVLIAHQPPIFDDWLRRFVFVLNRFFFVRLLERSCRF